MASDVMLDSDRRQSVSEQDVADAVAINRQRAETFDVLMGGPLEQVPVPKAGVYCPKDKKHGRMLMNKGGLLECGPCGFQVAAPKD